MNNKKKYRRILCCLSAVLTITFSSCESFIDVGPSKTQLEGAVVFDDIHTADAALAHIYSRLQMNVMVTGGPNGLSVLMGAYTDELTSFSNYGLPDERFFTNNILPDDAAVLSLWADSYNLIYAANVVIEGVTNSLAIADPDKDRLKGEALFLRAYLYYYLTGLFGDIPYATSTDYNINTQLTRTASRQVYEFIIADLQLSASLLQSEYTTAGRVRPNSETARALLARTALAYGDNALALEASSIVIAQTALYGIANLDATFLVNSPGTLWQLAPAANGFNTFEGESFIFETAPPHTRALSEGLYSAFEESDLRRQHWVGTVTDGTATYHFANKYKLMAPTGTSQEYSIQFRIEELYLIRAEAYARLGQLDLAAEDLNTIRTRVALPPTTATTQAALLSAILNERRFEFFTEHGHRFFDLKRHDMTDSVLQDVKPGWDTTDVLLPIPQNELLINRNLLPQNEGY